MLRVPPSHSGGIDSDVSIIQLAPVTSFSQVFNQQTVARAKQPSEDASPKPQETEDGFNS
jgi:hypothetical protein